MIASFLTRNDAARNPGRFRTPHQWHTDPQSAATSAAPPHMHRSATPATSAGHSLAGPPNPAVATPQTRSHPALRSPPARTTQNGVPAAIPAYPVTAETSDPDQQVDNPSP